MVNNEEWKDEIGKVFVNIPAETRFRKGIMTCQFPFKRLTSRHDGVKYAIPVLYLYWRAENADEWILLRCDADYLFNYNYTGGYIWDETTNYVKVMPQIFFLMIRRPPRSTLENHKKAGVGKSP